MKFVSLPLGRVFAPVFVEVFLGEPAREVCFARRFPARPFSQHHCMKCNDERGKRTSASSLYLHLCAPAGAAAAGRTFNERALMLRESLMNFFPDFAPNSRK